MIPTTIWKPVPGFEEHFEVSNTGHVRSLYRTSVNNRNKVMLHKSRRLKKTMVDGRARVTLAVKGAPERRQHLFVDDILEAVFRSQ